METCGADSIHGSDARGRFCRRHFRRSAVRSHRSTRPDVRFRSRSETKGCAIQPAAPFNHPQQRLVLGTQLADLQRALDYMPDPSCSAKATNSGYIASLVSLPIALDLITLPSHSDVKGSQPKGPSRNAVSRASNVPKAKGTAGAAFLSS